MKFILAENIKHILNEKYLLDERYILTEASEKWQGVLKNWFNTINDLLNQVTERLNQIKEANTVSQNSANLEADWKAINNAANDVKISRQNPKGQDEELKKDLVTWYQAVKALVDKRAQYRNNINSDQIIKADDPKIDRMNTRLNDLNKYLTGNFDRDQALGIFDTFDNSLEDSKETIEKVFKNAASTQQKSSSDKIDNLNKACDNAAEKINTLKEYIALGYNGLEDNEIKEYKDQLEELAKKVNAVIGLKPQINFNNYDANFKDYINKINSISEWIDLSSQNEPLRTVLAKAEEEKAKAEAEKAKENARNERQNAAVKDWKALYDKCNTPEEFKAFWEDYFKTEWGAKAKAVSAFGAAFTDDLKKIGWDSITNPFIKFLKTDVIYNAIGKAFDQAAYISIHNAYVHGYIRQSDLTAAPNSLYKKSNLIFNLHLYAESLDNFNRYLKYQSQLAISGNAGSLKPPAGQVWVEDREKVLNNLMLADGDIDNFDKEINAGGELRSLTEIAQVLQQAADINADEKQTATNKNVIQVLDRVKDETTAKRLLAYLIDILRGINQSAVDDADTKIGKGIIYDAHDKTPRITINQADNFDNNYLDRHNLDYNKKQWVDIILGLAAKAGLYTPKKEAK